MSTKPDSLLLIAVDCPPETGGKLHVAEPRCSATAEWLVDLFAEFALPASWAMADPARNTHCRGLLQQRAGHRITLLADPCWAGASRGRTAYARELNRRATEAATAGIVISSLSLRGMHSLPHLDLLVRHRIGVIRGGAVARRRTNPLRCECSRYGIWRAEPTMRWPARGGWFGWNLAGPQRQLAGRLPHGQVTHLLLDTASPSLRNPQGRRRLRKFLVFAQRQVEMGELVCLTLERLVDHLRGEQTPRPRKPAPRRVA
jgi:hypothetical protein